MRALFWLLFERRYNGPKKKLKRPSPKGLKEEELIQPAVRGKHLQPRDILIALTFSSMAPGPSQAGVCCGTYGLGCGDEGQG